MILLLALVMGLGSALAHGEESQVLEQVEVVGTTPLHGVGLPKGMIPANVQSASGADIEKAQVLDLSEFLNRRLGSVTINAAQNNPLQPDLQFRGFTASPLLGLPQGIAVYQDGVRLNEPFGDTVNWDLIPESAIGSINLIAGPNPLFGLNTLGGALSIQTKNGFTHPGHTIETYGGTFGRVVPTVESGWNNGTFGYFFTTQWFNEAGWREFSDSSAFNLFGTLSWRSKTTTLDLSISHGDTALRGNGPAPVQLLALNREAVFTHPDITENNLQMVTLNGTHWVGERIQISGNAFYRHLDTDSFNGDATAFEECKKEKGLLCEPEEDEPIRDQFGALVPEQFDAINNVSQLEQRSYGGSFQSTFLHPLFGYENQLILGVSYSQGLAEFDAAVELATLDETRGTRWNGLFVPAQATRVKARSRSWAVYFMDTFSITEQLALTVTGRYHNTRLRIGDLSGEQPELSGEHDFDRFNPAVGLSYQWRPEVGLYGSYSESSRAPTPVELTCASEEAPCTLPNAFLADPPLEQVVAKSWEIGLRGELHRTQFGERLAWNVAGFHTTNQDDILFQTTGGVTGRRGFFANIGATQRQGVEVNLYGRYHRADWFLNYSFIEATFQKDFRVRSPHHPQAIDFDGDGEADGIEVRAGDRIPNLPQHILKLGANLSVTSALTIGADLLYNGTQFLRGDEGNLLEPIDDFVVVNLHGEYRLNKHLTAFARIDNLFDTDYETFGLLGNPAEVLEGFDDPRFLGPGAPRGGWVGIRLSL